MIRIESDDRVTISGLVALDTLLDYKREAEEQIPVDRHVLIDLADVQIRGSAILALLVLIVRRSRQQGHGVDFCSVGNELAEMAQLAGLTGLLDLQA